MCKSKEHAEEICFRHYADKKVGKSDYNWDGHYYRESDLDWVTVPDAHSHGTLGVKSGAIPLCELERIVNESATESASPPAVSGRGMGLPYHVVDPSPYFPESSG